MLAIHGVRDKHPRRGQPAYGDRVLESLIPLGGVLVGVAASFLATSVHERGAFRRTMATRWDDRRIETYIAYVAAVKAAFRAARAVRQAAPGDASQHARAREDAESQRSLLFESVVLLAGPATSEAAHAVNRRLWHIYSLMTAADAGTDHADDGADDGAGDGGDAAFAAAEAALFAAITEFHAMARRDLGVGAPATV